MIRASLLGGRVPTILIGLSRANWDDDLAAGEGLHVVGKEVGIPGVDVLVLGGHTEMDIIARLERHGLIGAESAAQMRAALQLQAEVPATRDQELYWKRPGAR